MKKKRLLVVAIVVLIGIIVMPLPMKLQPELKWGERTIWVPVIILLWDSFYTISIQSIMAWIFTFIGAIFLIYSIYLNGKNG